MPAVHLKITESKAGALTACGYWVIIERCDREQFFRDFLNGVIDEPDDPNEWWCKRCLAYVKRNMDLGEPDGPNGSA
jgi:hypothetical protein